jgi:uncharacterized protein (TIGR02246 family)
MHEDETQIRQLIATWLRATREGDTRTVLDLMTEDVVFLRPGHEPMIGRAAYAAQALGASGGKTPQFDGASDIREIRVIGDFAYCWSHLRVTITPPGGAAMVQAGYILSVLRREHGKWRIARDANLLLPETD